MREKHRDLWCERLGFDFLGLFFIGFAIFLAVWVSVDSHCFKFLFYFLLFIEGEREQKQGRGAEGKGERKYRQVPCSTQSLTP